MQAWREMRHGLIGAEREKAQDEDRLSTDTEGERTSLERARERRVERENARGKKRKETEDGHQPRSSIAARALFSSSSSSRQRLSLAKINLRA